MLPGRLVHDCANAIDDSESRREREAIMVGEDKLLGFPLSTQFRLCIVYIPGAEHCEEILKDLR